MSNRDALLAMLVGIWLSPSGCVHGFSAGYPEDFYTTNPQDRPYREIQSVRASVLAYGLSGAKAKEHAARRVYEKARMMGADGVVGVKTKGYCFSLSLLILFPDCSAKAEGVAVNWKE